MNDLPRCQQLLFDLLIGRGDVEIATLYLGLGGPSEKLGLVDSGGRSYAQSWLSTYIRNLNRSLEHAGSALRVKVGEKRRHYRLVAQT